MSTVAYRMNDGVIIDWCYVIDAEEFSDDWIILPESDFLAIVTNIKESLSPDDIVQNIEIDAILEELARPKDTPPSLPTPIIP